MTRHNETTTVQEELLIRGFASYADGGNSIDLTKSMRTKNGVTYTDYELVIGTAHYGQSTTSSVPVFPGMSAVLRAIADRIDAEQVKSPNYLQRVAYSVKDIEKTKTTVTRFSWDMPER